MSGFSSCTLCSPVCRAEVLMASSDGKGCSRMPYTRWTVPSCGRDGAGAGPLRPPELGSRGTQGTPGPRRPRLPGDPCPAQSCPGQYDRRWPHGS